VRKKRIKCVALVNVSCGDSILVESILRENYQQKGFHAAKTHSGRIGIALYCDLGAPATEPMA
jgi:hypothetical protein